MFDNIDHVMDIMTPVGYFIDRRVATVIFLAARLQKPVLVEGPAGVGKTQLAYALAQGLGTDLIRLQCYEGLDEAKALYEWNYTLQLLYLQAEAASSWQEARSQLFSEEFLLKRPLLQALLADRKVVLLIDEIDKSDAEFESFLLEALSDFQVTIPEFGTVKSTSIPFVVLTSNNSRPLSDALKRRCLHLYLDYPEEERERTILCHHVPGLPEMLASQIVSFLNVLRRKPLKKAPGISEAVEWAQALQLLGYQEYHEECVLDGLSILAKYKEDEGVIIREARTVMRESG
ncbi:MAG: AAA family ATPase [Dethiobacteria bacterium]